MQITATFDSIEEMESFARQIVAKAEGQVQAGEAEKKAVKVQEPDPRTEPEPTQEQPASQDTEAGAATVETEFAQKETAYTLEEVRAKLAELQKAGKRAEVKGLLGSFGVSKLSEVPADRYAALMVKAGEL